MFANNTPPSLPDRRAVVGISDMNNNQGVISRECGYLHNTSWLDRKLRIDTRPHSLDKPKLECDYFRYGDRRDGPVSLPRAVTVA